MPNECVRRQVAAETNVLSERATSRMSYLDLGSGRENLPSCCTSIG